MRENEGKRKQARELQAFAPKLLHKVISCTKLDWGLYTAHNQGKLPKCIKYQKYKEGSLGKMYKKW